MTTPSLFQHVPKGGLRPLDVFFGKNGANKLAVSSSELAVRVGFSKGCARIRK